MGSAFPQNSQRVSWKPFRALHPLDGMISLTGPTVLTQTLLFISLSAWPSQTSEFENSMDSFQIPFCPHLINS